MALPPIVAATLQSAVLSATSNILAQCLTAYQTDTTLVLDVVPIFHFVLYAFLNVPANFLWQDYLESTFPAYDASPPDPAAKLAAANDNKKLDKESKSGKLVAPRLNIINTIIKLLLDQTVGSAANTFLFSIFMHSIQAAMPQAMDAPLRNYGKSLQYLFTRDSIDYGRVDWNRVVSDSQTEFFPILFAGWKLWPFVSLINFAFIKTIEGRNLVASIAGVAWGVYMSLLAAR